MNLEQVALKAIEIRSGYDSAPSMGYAPDYGEDFDPADQAIRRLAEENGFTIEQVWQEMSAIAAADDGPYGRIE